MRRGSTECPMRMINAKAYSSNHHFIGEEKLFACYDSEITIPKSNRHDGTRLLSYKTCLDTKPVLYQDRF